MRRKQTTMAIDEMKIVPTASDLGIADDEREGTCNQTGGPSCLTVAISLIMEQHVSLRIFSFQFASAHAKLSQSQDLQTAQ